MHVEDVQNIDVLSFCKKKIMTGTALHTNEILQYLVLDKIVIAITAKNLIKFVLFHMDFCMRICDVLLNFFVSVYIFKIIPHADALT